MKKIVSKSLLSMLSLMVIVGCSFFIFTRKVEGLAYKGMQQRIIETSENSAKAMKQLINHDANQLRSIAAQLNEGTTDTEKEELLQRAVSYTEFLKIRIYDREGNGIEVENGEVVSYHEQDMEKLSSQRVVLQSMQQQEYIGIDVPILLDEKGMVGRIQGVYTSNYITNALDISLFSKEGQFGIVDLSGELLWQTGITEGLSSGRNVFDELANASFRKGYDVAQLKQDMELRKSSFSIFEQANNEYCVYQLSMDIGDWYLMAVVPSSYLLAQMSSIQQGGGAMMVLMCVAFFILSLLLFQSNRKAKRTIELEKERLERVINSVPAPILLIDRKRTITMANKVACDLFQKSVTELVGKPCSCIATSSCHTSHCAIEKIESTGIGTTFMDVNQRHFMISTSFMYDQNNERIGFVEVMQEISDLLKAQHILEEQTIELETISHNLAVGVLVTAMEEGFPIIRCNESYLKLIGYEEAEVLGQKAIQWVTSDDAKDMEASIYEQFRNKESVKLEHRIQRKDGSMLWISLSGKQMQLHGKAVGVWILMDISEQKEIMEQLKVNEERYRIAAQNTEDIIVDFDVKSKRMIHTERITEIYGLPEILDNVPESLISSDVIDEQSKPVFMEMFACVLRGEEKASCDILSYAKDGRKLWNHFTFITIFDSDGLPIRAIGIMHDFTKEKNAQLKYKREAQYRKMTMEDAALYYEVNLTKRIFITGYESLVKNYVKKATNDFDTVVDLLLEHVVYAPDRELVNSFINWKYLLDAYMAGKQKIEFEYRRMLGHHDFGWVMCTLYLLKDEETGDINCLGYIKDIDESKKLELSLKHQAESDLLTGLYNKITTESMIEKALKEKLFGALMIVDLDDFKSINDNLGHAFGDAVLSEISQQLKTLFLNRGVIGRVGGDEFIIFLNDLHDDKEIEEHAKAICEIFHHTYTGMNNLYKVSGTVGIACAPEDGCSFETLYQNADIALYYAKNNGKDTYCRYLKTLPQIGSDKAIRSIDKNAGKSFSDNIIEYVLRILHGSNEPKAMLHAVLELVSKHYNFSRSYLFEKSEDGVYWNDSFEWCGDDVTSHMQTLQHVPYERLIPYFDHFDEEGRLLLYDIESLDATVREEFVPKDIRSMVQFVIQKNQEVVAFVGFDDCILHRNFDEKEVETLRMVVMLIDAFIIRSK